MGNYIILILIYASLYAFMALGQNIITGYCGILSLCQAGFFAIGSYAVGILTTKCSLNFWPSMLVGIIVAMLLGFLIGLPTLRLKGDYLAIATLGLNEIIRNIINNWTSFTGGAAGLRGIPKLKFFGTEINPYRNKIGFLFVVLLVLALCCIFIEIFIKTRNGRAIEAVREDELASMSSGINSTIYKIISFCFAAALASIGGAFYAVLTLSIAPGTYTFMMSVMVLCMVVLGGMGNTWGVLLGSLIIQVITYLPDLLNISGKIPPQLKEIIFGFILVLMMIFRPQGLLGRAKRLKFSRDGRIIREGGFFKFLRKIYLLCFLNIYGLIFKKKIAEGKEGDNYKSLKEEYKNIKGEER